MPDEKYEGDFDGKHGENDGFDRAKTKIKLLLPRIWLRLGEYLVAQLQNL
jgi:hypothetical protein